MKLKDLILEKNKIGTFAGFLISQDDEDNILTLIDEIGVPNPIDRTELHVTVLYSRKFLPDYEPIEKLEIWAYPTKFHIFKSQDGKNVLVIMLDCDDCVKRHKELMKTHKATYDFPEYLPHLTLSYDIGNWFDADPEKINEKFKNKLPKEVLIIGEFKKNINLD